MGCVQDKLEKEADADAKVEKFGGAEKKVMNDKNEDPDASNLSIKTCTSSEKLGVSGKDLYRFRQSWKGIKRKMEDTGIEMFVRLFKHNAELKLMFSQFKYLETDDDLRTDEALEHHATLVMMTLDDAITHIDNYEYVTEVLRKTGASHIRFEGFKSDNFWKIQEPFLEAVKITLGDRYTENMESIYKVTLNFVLQTMVEGIEEAMQNCGNNTSNQDNMNTTTTNTTATNNADNSANTVNSACTANSANNTNKL